MKIQKLPFGPINANMYIVEGEEISVVIDPCVSLSYAEPVKSKYGPILITHCHYDHINRMEEIKNILNTKVMAHPLDIPSFSSPDKNGSAFFLSDEVFEKPEGRIEDKDEIKLGHDSFLRVIHTPGHTRGSVCFLLLESGKHTALFSGDTLFKGSAGRTDLGGDPIQMDRSLYSLSSLDDDIIVYPGHGEDTTIGDEKEHNPFLKAAIRKIGD